MRNKRRLIALSVVAVAAVVLTGGLLASNMGFKLNFTLNKQAAGVSKSGTNYVALPFNPQVGIGTAKALFLDIQAGGGVNSVQKHTRSSDEFQVYTFGTGDFALTSGEGYIVKAGADQNYIIVGSHDPSATVTLNKQAVGVSKSATNYYAHPYHGVSETAKELLLEIGSATSVQKHTRLTDEFQVYTFGTGDYSLVPGEAYIVKASADVTFTPAHY